MKRIFRLFGLALGSLAMLGIIAYAIAYAVAEHWLRRTYDVRATAISVPTDSASIVEGRRLAVIHGCYGDCHGPQGKGKVFFDQPMIARVVAPNLTAAVRKYSDGELATLIRTGIRPGGRSTLIMPSQAFTDLSDSDLGCIIAFLKSVPAAAGPGPSLSLGPVGRIGLAIGKFRTTAQMIADSNPPPAAANEESGRGRHLARTICAQCHGTNLRGESNPDFVSPDLHVVAAYSPDDFVRLLRTGVAIGNRTLGVMSLSARNNLSQLNDAEIAALYSYLHQMPDGGHL